MFIAQHWPLNMFGVITREMLCDHIHFSCVTSRKQTENQEIHQNSVLEQELRKHFVYLWYVVSMIWGFILKRAWTHGRSELLLWFSMFYDPFLFSFSAWLDFHLTMWTRIRITRNIQTTSQHDEICQILIVISSDFDFCEHFKNTHSILPHITFSLCTPNGFEN